MQPLAYERGGWGWGWGGGGEGRETKYPEKTANEVLQKMPHNSTIIFAL